MRQWDFWSLQRAAKSLFFTSFILPEMTSRGVALGVSVSLLNLERLGLDPPVKVRKAMAWWRKDLTKQDDFKTI